MTTNQAQNAASSSVGNNTLNPPQNAFQNPFSGIVGRLGSAWNTISQNGRQIGNVLNNARIAMQTETNPATKQAQLTQQAIPVSQFQGSPALDVAAPKGQKPATQTQINQALAANPNNAKTYSDNNNATQVVPQTGNPTPLSTQSADQAYLATHPTTSSSLPQTGGANNQNNTINSMANNGDVRSQVVNSLANMGNTPDVQSAYNTVYNLESGLQAGNNKIMNKPIGLDFQQGQQAALQRDYGPQLTAAEGILQSAITGQGQQLAGKQAVLGATQPQLGQYGLTYYQPPVSAFQGGGVQTNQNGLQLSGVPATDLNTLAQAVNNGSIDYNSALSQLSGYGTAVQNQLLPSIQKINPQFSVNASNASQQTTAVGQQLTAAIPPANQALDLLQDAFNKLGALSGSNIPFVQEFSQNVAMQTGVGRTAVSNFQGALQEARSRIDAALTGVIGVDAAGKQANALLPDNMMSTELPQKIAAAKQYLQNQLQSYTKSGTQTGSSTSNAFGNTFQ